MKLARLHIVELVAHEVDIEWRDDIRRAGPAADLAVLRVGDAGQKVDQPAGDRRIGLFQVEEHGAAIAQMLRDLGHAVKAVGRDEHDRQLARGGNVHDLAALRTGGVIASPFVQMSQTFQKQANLLWYEIFDIVKQNCTTKFDGTPQDDLMEQLLSSRK